MGRCPKKTQRHPEPRSGINSGHTLISHESKRRADTSQRNTERLSRRKDTGTDGSGKILHAHVTGTNDSVNGCSRFTERLSTLNTGTPCARESVSSLFQTRATNSG